MENRLARLPSTSHRRSINQVKSEMRRCSHFLEHTMQQIFIFPSRFSHAHLKTSLPPLASTRQCLSHDFVTYISVTLCDITFFVHKRKHRSVRFRGVEQELTEQIGRNVAYVFLTISNISKRTDNYVLKLFQI